MKSVRRATVRAIRAGAVAGFAGGVLMAAWATVYAAGVGAGILLPLRLVGEAIRGERALVGVAADPFGAIVIHIALSIALGIPFSLVMGSSARPRLAVPAGISYGLLIWFVTTAALLPLVNPAVAAEARLVPSSWLIGHVLFGLGVSIAPALRRRWTAARAAPGIPAPPLAAAAPPRPTSEPPFFRDRWPRIATFALGAWLSASTFVWGSVESSSGFNTLVNGLLVMTFSAVALWAPQFRFANTAIAVWLLYSGVLFRHEHVGRALSTVIVAGAIAALSVRGTPARLVNPHRKAV